MIFMVAAAAVIELVDLFMLMCVITEKLLFRCPVHGKVSCTAITFGGLTVIN